MSKCRSCGADILWARTKAGKLMPVDAAESSDGNVFVAQTERGLTAFIPEEGTVIDGASRHKSHFATCPNAAKHRKPKE